MDQVLLEQSSGKLLTQHSLEFIHVFLNASIACILYSRRLINWRSTCFLTRQVSQLVPGSFATVDDIYGYFCSSRCELIDDDDESQVFKIMQKGHHRCANEALGMLNTGIMDALRHNYLRAMKLFVGGKTGNTSAIVESYTFLFHRTSGITTVELREADDSFHVENLQRSFKKAIASLLVSMRGLPTLPKSGRNLSVCLHYQDTCPLNYQPVGFLEADKSRALLWEKGDDSLHTTGFELADYAVSVKVRKYVNDGGEDNLLSRQIRELQQTSSRDHGLPPTFDAAASKKKRKRMAEDQPSSSFRQSRRRSLPPDQLDCENAQIVEVEKDGIVEEKKQVKISTSERLVHFSSSTHTNTTSNEDSERWC